MKQRHNVQSITFVLIYLFLHVSALEIVFRDLLNVDRALPSTTHTENSNRYKAVGVFLKDTEGCQNGEQSKIP